MLNLTKKKTNPNLLPILPILKLLIKNFKYYSDDPTLIKNFKYYSDDPTLNQKF